MATVLIYLIL